MINTQHLIFSSKKKDKRMDSKINPDIIKSLGESEVDGLMKNKLAMIPALIKMKGLLNHHIASFDHLIGVEMEKILLNDSNCEIRSSVDPNIYVRYTGIRVKPPLESAGMGVKKMITPQECRQRDSTYRGEICVDIEFTSREPDPTDKSKRRKCFAKDIPIGYVPIMLRSKKCNLYNKTREELIKIRECPLDPGGYFIVKGVEKVCLVQEQQSKNRVIIESDDHGAIIAHVQSKTHYSISKCSIIIKKGRIMLQHRSFTEDVPIVILLRALGFESDQMIAQHIGLTRDVEQLLFPCFEQAMRLGIHTQNEALSWIGERRKDSMMDDGPPVIDPNRAQNKRSRSDQAAEFLAKVLLCHIRDGEVAGDWNFRHKGLYVCYMVRRMIEASVDRSLLDERDYYGNKRFETTGTLMGLLFEDLLKLFNRQVKITMDQHLSKSDSSRQFDPASILDRKNVITHGFQQSLSSGRWELKRFNMSRHGVTQVLSRLSYISSLGMMTRLASSFEKSRKVSGPRALQPSQWGMVCPCDTPEGESCGLVKNFAYLSQVTLDQDDSLVRSAAHNLGVEEVDTLGPFDFLNNYTVFLNGTLIGVHRYPNRLCQGIRQLRRSGRLHPHVSVFAHSKQKCVHIGCDGGRVARLYMLVKNGKPAVTAKHLEQLKDGIKSINDFLCEGLAEFIDVNEANDCLIAVYPADIQPMTTHMEVDPLSLLGVIAGCIPYPHHNQAARNTFQSAMGKQAMGGIACNQQQRVDTILLLGAYPQRPLCRSTAMTLHNFEKLGAGINAMVCVMSYSGYDIEDAQIYNRASLDRGYARGVVLKKHEVNVKTRERVKPPPAMDKNAMGRGGNFRFAGLGPAGIVSKGTRVTKDMILVNKVTEDGMGGEKPSFLTYKLPQPSVVDHVYITRPDSEYNKGEEINYTIKVITREVRIPEPGDKFSSRHGQKGVVGLITDAVNLPFNEKGMTPDMIMNPHGFPSRMTVGKLLELMSAKAGVISGHFGDGTAFAGDKAEDIGRALVAHGYNYDGKDVFYSGITGDMMQSYVFFGPIYYQRLKHMVIDKMHARATGPRSMLTRQPTEGRARNGGLRVGEMERDCMVGYGAAMLLNERLLKSSDLFTADVCQVCGHLGYKRFCPYCATKGTVSRVNMPYAFKLLLQELQGMGISARLSLESIDAE